MERDGQHFIMELCPIHLDLEQAKADGFKPVRFHSTCPPLFRATDLGRLPDRLRDAAKAWVPEPEKHSLLLHGTTGNGKTRTAWWIANRLWAESRTNARGFDLCFRTMSQLTDEITSSFSKDMGHESLMKRLNGVDLLVMDDLGKEKMTARVCADLFSIIDHRANYLLPTIVTTNFNGSGLSNRFEDPEMGVAFVRRLRDYYTPIGA